ncbi:MAG: glucose-6-phosphate isomerase [Malacoplasma sp.]|nr:glucose-6-phosphate isomerase [Malacoplasma sp.]MDE5841375.1 glucose-6-phosphate isomerase [Malacoplasma sp.]MDE6429119.1 glucose-6-phosphate isomerase [Malacoplasma sp.]
MIKLNLDNFLTGPKDAEKIFKTYKSKIETLNKSIEERKCKGASMLGWIEYPKNYDKSEIKELINLSKEWHNNKKIKNVVLLGIGGSYIGVRAGIDLVLPEFNRDKKIYYVSSMSSSYIASLLEKLKKEEFYLIVVSKSGTTLEVGVAFRIFYSLLFEKFGSEGAKERIVAITDKSKGTLRKIAHKQKIRTFSIPSDIGGRFSAITPVGLFAMGVMGLDVEKVLKGCAKAIEATKSSNIEENTAYQYAALRHYEYEKNKKSVEVFCIYENALQFFSEHLKQLFAESEGKEGKGLLPFNCLFSTDLHSVGQFLQEGNKILFETCIEFRKPLANVTINEFLNDEDGLGFLNGKKLDYINKVAASSTIDAHHIEGNVDVIKIELEQRNEETFGYLYSWFSKAVTMSGLLLKVNPFDQPGVEAYKKRMFAKLQD